MTATQKCTYCGKEHDEQATVCTLDGQPLIWIGGEAPAHTHQPPRNNSDTVPAPQPSEAPGQPSESPKALRRAGLGALLTFGGFIVIWATASTKRFYALWGEQDCALWQAGLGWLLVIAGGVVAFSGVIEKHIDGGGAPTNNPPTGLGERED
jgi:hypothetical protein